MKRPIPRLNAAPVAVLTLVLGCGTQAEQARHQPVRRPTASSAVPTSTSALTSLGSLPAGSSQPLVVDAPPADGLARHHFALQPFGGKDGDPPFLVRIDAPAGWGVEIDAGGDVDLRPCRIRPDWSFGRLGVDAQACRGGTRGSACLDSLLAAAGLHAKWERPTPERAWVIEDREVKDQRHINASFLAIEADGERAARCTMKLRGDTLDLHEPYKAACETLAVVTGPVTFSSPSPARPGAGDRPAPVTAHKPVADVAVGYIAASAARDTKKLLTFLPNVRDCPADPRAKRHCAEYVTKIRGGIHALAQHVSRDFAVGRVTLEEKREGSFKVSVYPKGDECGVPTLLTVQEFGSKYRVVVAVASRDDSSK